MSCEVLICALNFRIKREGEWMMRNECSAAWTMLVINDKHLCRFSALCFPRTVAVVPKPVNELVDLAVIE